MSGILLDPAVSRFRCTWCAGRPQTAARQRLASWPFLFPCLVGQVGNLTYETGHYLSLSFPSASSSTSALTSPFRVMSLPLADIFRVFTISSTGLQFLSTLAAR